MIKIIKIIKIIKSIKSIKHVKVNEFSRSRLFINQGNIEKICIFQTYSITFTCFLKNNVFVVVVMLFIRSKLRYVVKFYIFIVSHLLFIDFVFI